LRDELEKFVKKHEGAYVVEGKVKDHDDEGTPGFEDETPRFVQLLCGKRAANGSVSTKVITPIFHQLNEERKAREADVLSDKQLAKVVKALNTDARLGLWLESRQEPLLSGGQRDETTILGVKEFLEGPDLGALVSGATELEETCCSWQATIGPAVKALRRLGRTSAGKDFDKLAKYAKEHAKPSS